MENNPNNVTAGVSGQPDRAAYYAPVNPAPVAPVPVNPAREERRSIRRFGNAIGGSLLIQAGLSITLQTAFLLTLYLMGRSITEANAFLRSPQVIWLYQAAASAIVMIVPFFLCTRFCGTKVASVARFGKPERGMFWPLFLLGVWVTAISNIADNLFLSVIDYDMLGTEYYFGEYPQGFFGTTMVTLVIAAMPALVEEFAFRGVVLGILRRVSDGFAIIASALFFSLMHGNITQMPFTLLFGIYLGYMTVASGSIWPAVLLHGFNNLLSVGIDYIGVYGSASAVNVANIVYVIASPIIGIIGIAMICAGKSEKFFIRKSACFNRFGGRLGAMLTSPCVVIYIVYVAFEVILNEVMR